MYGSQWGSLAVACSLHIKKKHFLLQVSENLYQYYKSHENLYQYYKSRENPYQVLQVTRAASERAMKSKDRMINHHHHSTTVYQKKYHSFVAVGIVTSAAHSLQYRRQQTRDTFWYSFGTMVRFSYVSGNQ